VRERGGGGWLSGLSAAAPEVPPDVEAGSANRGVPGSSKDETAKRNTGEEEERRRRARRTRTRRRARRRARGPGRGAAWAVLYGHGGFGDPKLLSDVDEKVPANSGRETAAQDDGGSKQKGKRRREGRRKPKQLRARAKAKE